MSEAATTYSGWVWYNVFTNKFFGTEDVNVTINFKSLYNNPSFPAGILGNFITWDNDKAPPGFSRFLGAPVPSGYTASYTYYYALTGRWDSITNIGPRNQFKMVLQDKDRTNISVDTTLYTNSSGNFCNGPVITPPGPPPGWGSVQGGCNPFSIGSIITLPGILNVQSYYPTIGNNVFPKENITLQLVCRIIVNLNCTANTIATSLRCQQSCEDNPLSENCTAIYNAYCLDSTHPERFGTDVCYKWLIARRSRAGATTPAIDAQGIAYCSSKYKSLQDFTDNAKGNDRNICGCFIRSREVEDPNATALYDNFANDVIKVQKFPNFIGKTKCLFPGCANSFIGYQGINGACAVPECVIVNEINNNGTINGEFTIVNECKTGEPNGPPDGVPETWLWIIGVVCLIIVVVIIILAVAGVFNRKERKSKKNRDDSTGAYDASLQARVPGEVYYTTVPAVSG